MRKPSKSRRPRKKSTFCHRVERTRKNTIVNPLARFLEEEPDADSRLARVAQQESGRHVDLDAFRAELRDKLRRITYSQPRDPQRRKYTFFDRMKKTGVLHVFLRTSTLRQISDWLILRDVIRTDRELESKKLSVAQYPVRFHSFLTSELSRHENAVTKAMSKYKVDELWLDEYMSGVNREKMRQLRILSLSRWPGIRGALLKSHRDENLAAEIGVFELLRHLFENTLTDRFLRRLTQLVCASPKVDKVDNERDEALRIALSRRR